MDRNSKLSRKVPFYRPCNIRYEKHEIYKLQNHQLWLDTEADIDDVNKRDAASNLQFKNWKRVQPGMWVKGLIGPMTTEQAMRREKQEDKSYRQLQGN